MGFFMSLLSEILQNLGNSASDNIADATKDVGSEILASILNKFNDRRIELALQDFWDKVYLQEATELGYDFLKSTIKENEEEIDPDSTKLREAEIFLAEVSRRDRCFESLKDSSNLSSYTKKQIGIMYSKSGFLFGSSRCSKAIEYLLPLFEHDPQLRAYTIDLLKKRYKEDCCVNYDNLTELMQTYQDTLSDSMYPIDIKNDTIKLAAVKEFLTELDEEVAPWCEADTVESMGNYQFIDALVLVKGTGTRNFGERGRLARKVLVDEFINNRKHLEEQIMDRLYTSEDDYNQFVLPEYFLKASFENRSTKDLLSYLEDESYDYFDRVIIQSVLTERNVQWK